MRILWVGNAPFVGSGYGEQGGLFVPRFKYMLGHDVAVGANYGIQATQMELDGIQYYACPENRNIDTFAEKHQADAVVILHDAWVIRPDDWDDNIPPVGIWAPVDHHPIPPLVLGVLQHERIRPIAMSQFGRDLMEQAHLGPLYVPHGIDTELFRPQPELRDRVRDSLDIPRDAFLVGMVAANRDNPECDRKSFAISFLAFAEFAKRHPDAYMYVHSQAKPQGHHGRDLDILATARNVPEGRIRFPADKAWHLSMPREVVATLYQAFDVLLNPSRGEGFGIPVLEAQACGVPVITSNHSAMPELTGAGWLVDGQPHWDALQTADFFDPYWFSILDRLEQAYEARDDGELRERAVEFAQDYDADRVTETYWKPVLEALGRPRRPAHAPVKGAGRAERRRAERAVRKTTKGAV